MKLKFKDLINLIAPIIKEMSSAGNLLMDGVDIILKLMDALMQDIKIREKLRKLTAQNKSLT